MMQEATAVEERGTRKDRVGTVVSRSGDKTVTVRVARRFRHPVYGKVVSTSKKYHVHDDKNEAKVGDSIRIVECRPMSRLKRWRMVEVVAKGQVE
jgi:small subunit ribosomal protein S17